MDIIRLGTVNAVKNNTARVKFAEVNILSDWLTVVQASEKPYIPKVGDVVVCIYNIGFNEDGFILGKVS